MVRLISVFLFLFMSIFLCGQELVTRKNAPKKVLKLYEKAEKCLSKEKPLEAIGKLEEAVALEPRFIDGFTKLGGITYEAGQYETAIPYFQKALALDTTNFKLTQALAISHEKAKNYPVAIEYYKKLVAFEAKIRPEYKREVLKKIADFGFRESALANPVNFTPEILPAEINDPSLSEYSPSLTANGKRIFFTRVTNNQEDIFYSEKDSSGQWKKALIMPNLNTYENEGAHNISADGKTILFTFCSDGRTGKARGCNIYAAFNKGGSWSSPAYFSAINSKAWDTQPNISADGSAIIFVSKRPGGNGNSDLWWTKRNSEGKWAVPENMGTTINTSGNDESPFMHADGKTLYFKSDGHPGMGSFDLFRSELQDDGTWSVPLNLGYPINTEDHEGALVIALDGKSAFYSRGNGKIAFDRTQSDLFRFELPTELKAKPIGFVNIRVFDAETKLALEAEINVQSSDGVTKKLNTDSEASKLILLPLGMNYSLNIDKEKYYFHSERFELTSLNTAETAFEIDVYLRPIKTIVEEKVPEAVILKNVLFETASFDLLQESFFELDQLVKLLKENINMKIEIRGHTDNVGEVTDNKVLSENRARSVNDYLVHKGISQERLTFVGLGESEPIASNGSEDGKKINRRTEFIIVN